MLAALWKLNTIPALLALRLGRREVKAKLLLYGAG
jgi:hypothetical protein